MHGFFRALRAILVSHHRTNLCGTMWLRRAEEQHEREDHGERDQRADGNANEPLRARAKHVDYASYGAAARCRPVSRRLASAAIASPSKRCSPTCSTALAICTALRLSLMKRIAVSALSK
jgi:hypothetical protein